MPIKSILSLFLFLSLCSALLPTVGRAADNRHQFLLFYSNDVRGETEPCG